MCAGCHKITDPIGLALENFDSAGGYRATENGMQIDTTGTVSGTPIKTAADLGQVVHDYKGTSSCLVEKLYTYSVGRTPLKTEAAWMQYLKDSFAADGYRIPALLRRIATSETFYRVTPPQMQTQAPSNSQLALETKK